MASFNADIFLDVNTSKSEKKVKRLEHKFQKVEGTSRKILGVDKRIVQERRKAHDPRRQWPWPLKGVSMLQTSNPLPQQS